MVPLLSNITTAKLYFFFFFANPACKIIKAEIIIHSFVKLSSALFRSMRQKVREERQRNKEKLPPVVTSLEKRKLKVKSMDISKKSTKGITSRCSLRLTFPKKQSGSQLVTQFNSQLVPLSS